MDDYNLAIGALVCCFSGVLCFFVIPALIVFALMIPRENGDAIARKARQRKGNDKPTKDDFSSETDSQNNDA